MNFAQAMKARLEANGLFASQAQSIMEIIIADPEYAVGTMVDRWGHDVDGYPESGLNILYMYVKDTAYEWLKKNAPQAWFLPMFMPHDEQEKFFAEIRKEKTEAEAIEP